MSEANPQQLLQNYQLWKWEGHCNYVLEKLLLPYFKANAHQLAKKPSQEAILIENRINQQWIFTILNTLLMAPANTKLTLILDEANEAAALQALSDHQLELTLEIKTVESIAPGFELGDIKDLNQLMKRPEFWATCSQEKLLFVQTDSLLKEPLPIYFFNYPYLGSAWIPRIKTDYFQTRSNQGAIKGFFKIDTPINITPDPDIYPHLHGNGGLSIRHRSLMQAICQDHGQLSDEREMEDVFFSRHIQQYKEPPPLQIAQAFAFESSYHPSIGSHAAWKYLSSAELAEHLDQHLRHVWAMAHRSN